MAKSYKDDNRPSLQFYPDDWMKEPALRLCSLESHGLWINMLCIMWFGQPRGTLTVNGKSLDNAGLAKILGEKVETIDRLIAELESNNIFSRLPDGTIYCRRLFREWQEKEHKSKVRSEAGRKGAEKRWQSHSKTTAKMAASTSPSPSSSKNICYDNGKKDEHKESDFRSGGPKPVSDFIPSALKKLPLEAEGLSPKLKDIFERALHINNTEESSGNQQHKELKNKEIKKE